jgi:hypothetical protein
MRRRIALFGLLAALAASAHADDPLPPGQAPVPDFRRLPVTRAVAEIRKAGFKPGIIYELMVDPAIPMDVVVAQRPAPGLKGGFRLGGIVDLRIAAQRAGPAIGRSWEQLRTARGWTEPEAETPAPPPAPSPKPPAGSGPIDEGDDPTPPALVPPPVAPENAVPPPAAPPDATPPAAAPPAAVPPEVPAPATSEPLATGSPDAPGVAGAADPSKVPNLTGLSLNDAENLVRRARMTLYVERVAGHPVGKVLRQEPPPGTPRPPVDVVVVKVVVTAGGDALGATPPPAAVAVRDVQVPDVLDRYPAQARRILEDVGLVVAEEAADSGPAGRVADQIPGAGDRVQKGSTVRIRIAPGEAAQPLAPPDVPPERPVPTETPTPAPTEPVDPSQLEAPTPISPPEGTAMPDDRTLPIAFMWKAVRGATTYVLEVEEQGAEGWLPSVRRPVRTTAVSVDVERISASPAPLRWRVRALASRREGPACPWVVLR